MSKIFLFDLGNVLAYPIDNKVLYNKLNCKISYKDFEEYWLCNDLIIKSHMGLVSDDVSIRELLKYCKSNLSIKDFYKIYNDLDATFFSDTLEIIKQLKEKGYKVGLLSNLRLIDYNRYNNKIEKIKFDYIFLSYEMKCLKPNDEIYKKVINDCNCNPNDIVFFDDNDKNVIAAKNNGINCYKVTGNNIKNIFKLYFANI